jgi:NAD(P)-dependent dehydrogenase (short-subunit alcohol dehydrogenase family)
MLKKKKFNKPSSIVFLSSIASLYGMKGNGLYAITKASLNIMAKTYANELANKKIRVNTVAPGMVNTQITLDASEFLSDEAILKDKKKYPLGYGEPKDVALPIVFLLSDASKWITGQVLVLDGGRTAVI